MQGIVFMSGAETRAEIAARHQTRSARGAASPALDMLRFGAAAMVVLNHLRITNFMPLSEVSSAHSTVKLAVFQLTRLGLEAVVLFFVLSGFLVGGASIDKFMAGKFDLRKYAVDRFTRIYVPFIPAFGLTIALCMWLALPISWYQAAVNLFALQGLLAPPFAYNTVLWSLSYEIWFYIACGAVLSFFQFRHRLLAQAMSLIVIAASFVVFSQLDLAYCGSWLIGAAAYFIRRPQRRIWMFSGLLLTAAGLVLMQLTSVSREIDLHFFAGINRSVAILVLSAGFGLVVAASAALEFRRPLIRRLCIAASKLSSFSYTLYLLHHPSIDVLRHFGMISRYDRLDAWTLSAFLLNALTILLVCFVIYLLFERHTGYIRSVLYTWLAKDDSARAPVHTST